MSAGDGQLKIHPPVESSESQHEAKAADKLLSESESSKLGSLAQSLVRSPLSDNLSNEARLAALSHPVSPTSFTAPSVSRTSFTTSESALPNPNPTSDLELSSLSQPAFRASFPGTGSSPGSNELKLASLSQSATRSPLANPATLANPTNNELKLAALQPTYSSAFTTPTNLTDLKLGQPTVTRTAFSGSGTEARPESPQQPSITRAALANVSSYKLVSLSSTALFTPVSTERETFKTGNKVGDFVVNFGDGAVRNLTGMVDQTLRSIRDPLSTVRDVGTLGSTIIQHPGVVGTMAKDFGSELVGLQGAGKSGRAWGNVAATVGMIVWGSRESQKEPENKAVEGGDSIQGEVAKRSEVIGSAETPEGAKLNTNSSTTGSTTGSRTGKLETKVDGLAQAEPKVRFTRKFGPNGELVGDVVGVNAEPKAIVETKAGPKAEVGDDVTKAEPKTASVEPKPGAEPKTKADLSYDPGPSDVSSAEPGQEPKTSKPGSSKPKAGTEAKGPKPDADDLAIKKNLSSTVEEPAVKPDAETVRTRPEVKPEVKPELKPEIRTTEVTPVKPEEVLTNVPVDNTLPKPKTTTLVDDVHVKPIKEVPVTPAPAPLVPGTEPTIRPVPEPVVRPTTVKPDLLVTPPAPAPLVKTIESTVHPTPLPDLKPVVEPKPVVTDLRPPVVEPRPTVTDLRPPANVDFVPKPVTPVVPRELPVVPRELNVPVTPANLVTPKPETVPIPRVDNVPTVNIPRPEPTITPNLRPDLRTPEIAPTIARPAVPTDVPAPLHTDAIQRTISPAIAPADHPQLKTLSDHLDKLPASVPGLSDAQNRLTQFVNNPNLENYRNLSDSLRSMNSAAVREQAELGLAAARQSVVASSVMDTSQSIDRLLSMAGSRVGTLPSGVQSEAQDLIQQMKAAAHSLVTAELSTGQRVALAELQSSTYDLGQLLARSKGAQSEVENAMLQVAHAQRELAAANYLVRTGDTMSGQVVDFLKNYWTNILGATVVGLELRNVLGSTAQSLEAELKKLQDVKTDAPKEEQKKKPEEEAQRSSTPFFYSKEPMGTKPPETSEARQQAQNHSMYGVDVQWAFYQKGGPAVVAAVEESRPTTPLDNRQQNRIYGSDQQDKPSLPHFDYVKVRMPVTRMAAENPYLSTGISYRAGGSGKGNSGGQRGSSSADPNTAVSLMSKNYAFVVGPNQSGTSAVSRYGGPTPGTEAAESHNRDGQTGGNNANAQAPTITASAVAQNDPAMVQARSPQQTAQKGAPDQQADDITPLSTRV